MNVEKIIQDIRTAVNQLKDNADMTEAQMAVNIIGARVRDLTDWAEAQLTKKLNNQNTEE